MPDDDKEPVVEPSAHEENAGITKHELGTRI